MRFPGSVCVLQNEYLSIVKSFKDDYYVSESMGRWLVVLWSADLKKPYNKMVFRKVISNRNKKTKIFIKKQFIKVNQTEIGEKTRL